MPGLTVTVITLVSLVLILIAFDAAAVGWGADSRDPMPDDHLR